MKRKLMRILLAALLAVGLVGASAPAARADDTVYTEGTLYYTIANGSITITGCFGRDAEVDVPAMIAGIPVNTIASGAFANNEYVKTVYLPDTISKVGPGAFGEGVRVIYNANTDHPQDTPTDLILGLLTPAATDDPNATEPPTEPTEPPAEPTDPPAAPTPTHGGYPRDHAQAHGHARPRQRLGGVWRHARAHPEARGDAEARSHAKGHGSAHRGAPAQRRRGAHRRGDGERHRHRGDLPR